jgi:hypothetical protein
LLEGDLISAKKASMEPHGDNIVFIDLNIPCSQLGEADGKYLCKIWDSPEKPEMCRLFPSNQFLSIDTKAMVREPKLIEKIVESNTDLCPLFEDIKVDDVLRDQEKFIKQ